VDVFDPANVVDLIDQNAEAKGCPCTLRMRARLFLRASIRDRDSPTRRQGAKVIVAHGDSERIRVRDVIADLLWIIDHDAAEGRVLIDEDEGFGLGGSRVGGHEEDGVLSRARFAVPALVRGMDSQSPTRAQAAGISRGHEEVAPGGGKPFLRPPQRPRRALAGTRGRCPEPRCAKRQNRERSIAVGG